MTDFTLWTGCATVDITPPEGIHMGGYWGRSSGATGIHDRLMAKALVWGREGTFSVLVTLDLVAVGPEWVQTLRQMVQTQFAIPAERLMVCCSHTHAGPLTMPFRGMGEVDSAYLTKVRTACAHVIKTALAALGPTAIGYTKIPVQLGINRRAQRAAVGSVGAQNRSGPVVPYVHVVRLTGVQGVVATLFSHACHPVVLGNSNHSISGDFAGAAATWIEEQSGRPALFVNGACGDINPRITNGDFADVAALGRELGEAVWAAGDILQRVSDPSPKKGQRTKIDLPLIEPPPPWRLGAEKMALQLKAEIKKIRDGGGDMWARKIPEARLEWAQALSEKMRNGRVDTVQPFEIQVLDLAGIQLLGMEGEIFARYQLEIEAKYDQAILCGYANGCVGYIPTADEYACGGYEIDEAYKVFPSLQMVAPASEALIRTKVNQLLSG
jgi:neutral ceramidase